MARHRREEPELASRAPRLPSTPTSTGSPIQSNTSPSVNQDCAEFDPSSDATIQAARRAMEAAFQSLPVFSGQSERERERDRRLPRRDPRKNTRKQRQKWEQRLEATKRARGGIPGMAEQERLSDASTSAEPPTSSPLRAADETEGDGFVLRFPRQPGQPSHAVGREAVRVWNDGSAMAKWPTGTMAVSVNVDDHATEMLRRSGDGSGTMYRIMASLREAGKDHVVVYFDPYGEGSVTTPRGVVRLACSADGSGHEADEKGHKILEWDAEGTVHRVASTRSASHSRVGGSGSTPQRSSLSGSRPSAGAPSASVASATSALDSIVLPGRGSGAPLGDRSVGPADEGEEQGGESNDDIRRVRRFRIGKHLGVTYDLDTRTVRVYFDCKGVQHMFVQGWNPSRRTVEPGRSLFGEPDPARAAQESRQKEKAERARRLEVERRREQREERRRHKEAAAAEAEALANRPPPAKKPGAAGRGQGTGQRKRDTTTPDQPTPADDVAPSAEPDPEHSQYLHDIRSTVGGLLEGMQQMTRVAEMQRRLEELGE